MRHADLSPCRRTERSSTPATIPETMDMKRDYSRFTGGFVISSAVTLNKVLILVGDLFPSIFPGVNRNHNNHHVI